MNGIQNLKIELAGANAEAAHYAESLRHFKALLYSPKFAGEGNDYINTADVLNWIAETFRGTGAAREQAQFQKTGECQDEAAAKARLKATANRD